MLSVAYLVSGSISAFFSLVGLFYVFVGVFVFSTMPFASAQADAPPEFVGWFVSLFGLGFFGAFIISAALKFFAYQRLKQRRSKVFCMVVAGISCLGFPYGTLLGVFTFVVLSRPSVSNLFDVR